MKTIITTFFFSCSLFSFSQNDEKIEYINARKIEIPESKINRSYWFVTDMFNNGNEIGSYIFSLKNEFISSKWGKLIGCPMEKKEYLSGVPAIYSNQNLKFKIQDF